MFDSIAFRYDLLNQVLSMGIHHRWRKKAIRLLKSRLTSTHPAVLDIATGTAAFAIDAMALSPSQVTGIDISADMLVHGQKKVKELNLAEKIRLLQADSEALPFQSDSFDAATVGFGVRNFENLDKGLSEIARVLKSGSYLAVLEFSIPQKFPMNLLYKFYLSVICPFIGKLVSGNPIAYNYLFRSVEAFPYGENFRKILLKNGFREASCHPQTFGIVTIYLAKK